MTTDLLDLPTIDAAPAPASQVATSRPAEVVATKPSIKETVLAQFKDAEADMLALAAKYRNVAYAVNTPKGMKEAIAARADLRDNGRLTLTRTEKEVKADVNDLKRVMAVEVERLVAIVQPVEDAIDAQIKAEEQRKAAEKAERERVEALRIADLKGRVDTFMAGWVSRCNTEGMTAARIASGIAMLHQQQVPDDLQDVAAYFSDSQAAALRRMEDAQHAAERREEAARLEAQRIEQERQAAELARQRAELEAAAAALAAAKAEAEAAAEAAALALREQAEAEAARKLAAAAVQDMAMGDAPDPVEPDPAPLVEPAPHDTAEAFTAAPLFVDFDAPAVAADAASDESSLETITSEPAQSTLPTVAEEAPTLKLGAIAEKLGFVLTEAFIAEKLHIAVRGRDKRAVLWRESDWPAIRAALVEHVKALP